LVFNLSPLSVYGAGPGVGFPSLVTVLSHLSHPDHPPLAAIISSVASKINMGGDEWMEETLSSTVKPILGGDALMETFTGMLGGAPIDAISIRSYNSTIGKWEQRWLDNTSPGFAEYTGQYADDQFIGYSNRSFQPTTEGGRGVNSGVREVFFNVEADHFSWRLESTQDSGQTWTPLWYLEYMRTADGQ
jgi:uncharacterized protein DUF1579